MKLRLIDAKPQSDHRCNGLILTEDFGLVGFIYADFPDAIEIARVMVADFNSAEARREELASGVDQAFSRPPRGQT